jgi:hypothetical protein
MYLIKPKDPASVIPGEDGQTLPTDGRLYPEVTLFWRRRAADGDVDIVEVDADGKPIATETTGKKKA